MGWKILGINQWKDPDYRVRLEFAQRSKNQRKLLHLVEAEPLLDVIACPIEEKAGFGL